MLYFKIKDCFDCRRYGNSDKKGNFVIKDELFTYKEMEKLGIPFNWCNSVEVKKNNTYKFFGARFCENSDIIKQYC